MLKNGHSLALLLLALTFASCTTNRSLKRTVEHEVQSLGYGNWIIIADASYPFLENQSIRTITVDEEIPVIVDQVLVAIEKAQHTKPNFFLPRELRSVRNDQAPGIDLFRKDLEKAMHGYQARELEIAILNNLVSETAEKFTVLVIKTRTTLPYSSVFLDSLI